MGWIEEHLHRAAQGNQQTANKTQGFAAAARRRWQQLGDELRADVTEFNAGGQDAEFASEGDRQFKVKSPASGLELTITADFDEHLVRYSYSNLNSRSAGIPEGGILSMRQTRAGVDFFSSDERLTSEETRQVLLEPVLFPPQMAA